MFDGTPTLWGDHGIILCDGGDGVPLYSGPLNRFFPWFCNSREDPLYFHHEPAISSSSPCLYHIVKTKLVPRFWFFHKLEQNWNWTKMYGVLKISWKSIKCPWPFSIFLGIEREVEFHYICCLTVPRRPLYHFVTLLFGAYKGHEKRLGPYGPYGGFSVHFHWTKTVTDTNLTMADWWLFEVYFLGRSWTKDNDRPSSKFHCWWNGSGFTVDYVTSIESTKWPIFWTAQILYNRLEWSCLLTKFLFRVENPRQVDSTRELLAAGEAHLYADNAVDW